MQSRKPKPAPLALRMTLAVLTVLLASCATSSAPLSPEPVKPPAIPPLAAEARQPERPSICLPTCPAGLTRLRESLRDSLKPPTAPASPVNGSTTH